MRARATPFKSIQQRYSDCGTKDGGRGGQLSADHAIFQFESVAAPAAWGASAARARTGYRTTAVIEERFCAGVGSETRRKADASNFQHEFASFAPHERERARCRPVR